MRTGFSQESVEDDEIFARWRAIEAGCDPDTPPPSQNEHPENAAPGDSATGGPSGEAATDDDRFVLPAWVTVARATVAAAAAALIALGALGLAWHNASTSSDWHDIADRAIARSREHVTEISRLKAELAASHSEAERLQSRVEELASQSAASADEAALFAQATRAGQTAVDDIVACLGAQYDLNTIAYQYAATPTAGLENRLNQLAEDVSFWCGTAAESAAIFEQAVELTAS